MCGSVCVEIALYCEGFPGRPYLSHFSEYFNNINIIVMGMEWSLLRVHLLAQRWQISREILEKLVDVIDLCVVTGSNSMWIWTCLQIPEHGV